MKLKTSGYIVFALSVFSCAYWYTGIFVNYNQQGVVSVITEILWLPMLALLFIMPVIAFVLWKKQKYSLRSLFFYAMLLCVLTIAFMFVYN